MYSFLNEDVKWCYGWYKKGDGFRNDKNNPLTQKKINKFDETEWDIGTDNKIYKTLQNICKQVNGSRADASGAKERQGDTSLHLDMVTKVCQDKKDIHKTTGHFIARIYGGLNGPGEWNKYCRDMAMLFLRIKNHSMFEDAYMCQLENDCLDDVFTAYIGFKLKQNKTEEK